MRSPYQLAALATAALPDLEVCGVRAITTPGDFDAAEVTCAGGARWQVFAPRDPLASAAAAAEAQVLPALARCHETGLIPFTVPQNAGSALLPEGGQAVVRSPLPGAALNLADLAPGPGLAANLGRALAALHELPTEIVTERGVPSYSATEYRERHLVELDEAATTGRVPAALLRRWEQALEDVSSWRFQPVVVHGDLGPELIRVADAQVVAVSGWAQVRVADPADDLAWVLTAASEPAAESLMEAYQLRRTELADQRLAERALLLGELALARWLQYGVTHDRPEVVADAETMLTDLAEALDN